MLPTFQNLKKIRVYYLLACPAHIILLSTLKNNFPRKMFYGTINRKGYKSHILIKEIGSSRLWRMDFCRQDSEQNKVFTIFQILHFQYSKNIVLKDVL